MAAFRLPLLILLAVVLLGGFSLVELYTDWLWFGEVGFRSVFARMLGAKLALGLLAFLVALAVLWFNVDLALRVARRRELVLMSDSGPRVVGVDARSMRRLGRALAAFVALMVGFFAASRWQVLLFWIHSVPFGKVDPILGRDAGFYVFELPFLQFAHGLLLAIVALAAAGSTAAHVAGGNLAIGGSRLISASTLALRQLSLLAAVLFLLLAFGAWLRVPALLGAQSGILHGASWVDVHARMPTFRLLSTVAVIGAGLVVYQIAVRRFWPILLAVGLYLAVSVGGAAYAAILQRLFVAPDEQVRETPYITHNIAATRAAFALEAVEERQLSGEGQLTRADLESNAVTLANVPLWNDQPLLDTFSQIQEIRTYYSFASVDNDRYLIDGEYRQIMLSARELESASLPSRTWINERLTFTHGYGLTLGPVNQVTPEGLPVLFIKDLPPESSVDLSVEQPALYYGELSNDHVFVLTGTQEFDYPKGDDNVFARYEGEGGVPLQGFLRRLLFALRFRSADTLFSPNLTAESRVMLYRDISERVERIAPFLTYDPDPYLAISGGRLVWIQDAYTTSDRYPYSTRANGINYIRNSIKVTIDAYHGTTVFHLLDSADPVAAALAAMFPDLFAPLAAMPEDLRTRLRYPQTIFTLQAAVFATYHMTNPAVFYNREDQWEVPSIDGAGQPRRMEPYYTIMKLPGEAAPEYIQMLPFTPRQKDNLAAWMVARSDGENYGRLAVIQFPKQTLIFGPRQIAARISQDQEIAPQITLWNQQGSEVIQGSLLVVPIEESLLYVRPLYLRAAGGRIPELKRVVVAYQNQIAMEESLDRALDRLFPLDGSQERAPARRTAVTTAPTEVSERDDLVARARDHYERALEAQRAGDWARYGDEIRALGEVLSRLGGAR